MKTRVLVVDDSVVVRKIISDMLAKEEDLEVAGIAHHGKIALAKIQQVQPDVITLDVDMPEMDGIETLRELRKLYPEIPVLMLSGLTVRSAQLTFDALALGAADYVTKPSALGVGGANLDRIREELLAKIRALAIHRGGRVSMAKTRTDGPIEAVAIGVSTGGPNALALLLGGLPQDFPVPVLIVQHIPAQFTTHFVERLKTRSNLRLSSPVNGDLAEPGTAWLAPGDFHMRVERGAVSPIIRLNQDEPQNSCRPSVDVLFQSLAQSYPGQVLGVVMTGMGQDGMKGCEAIKSGGGQVIAQDRQSSVIWGMPRAVVEQGLADEIVHLEDLARVLCRYAAMGRKWTGSAVEVKP